MNIHNVDLVKLMPQNFLADDKAKKICEAINTELQGLAINTKFAEASYDVDNATSAVLEHIAWQLNSELFFLGVTLEEKKRLVKEAIQLHRRKGTKYAVEHAIQLIFPNAKVEEWFEYGGNPYYFRVINTERRSLREILTIISLINIMKSLRSWLDNKFEAEDEGLIDLNLLLNYEMTMNSKFKPNYSNSVEFFYIGLTTEWEIDNPSISLYIDNSNEVPSPQVFFNEYLANNDLTYITYNNFIVAEYVYVGGDYYVLQYTNALQNIYMNTHFSSNDDYENDPVWDSLLSELNLTEEEKETYIEELDELTREQMATWLLATKNVKRFIEGNNITISAFNSYADSHSPSTVIGNLTAEQFKILKADIAINHYLNDLDSWLLVEDEYITEKTENANAIKDLCRKYLNLYKEDYLNV